MKNSPLLKFGLALLFAVFAGSMICSPANALGNAEAIMSQMMDHGKKALLTDEQLEKKAPGLDDAFFMYKTQKVITKEQFLKYVRTHKDLK